VTGSGRWSPRRRWAALKRFLALYHLGDTRFAFMWDPPPADEWIALDCEATGLSVQRDEIVSIGAVRIVGNRLLTSQRLELLVKPGRAIRPDAVRVHGLRARDVAQGLEIDEAMHRLMRFIGSRPLVGYFLDFDLGLINRAIFPLLGVPLPQPRLEVSSMFYEWKFRQLPPYQQQGNVEIDLRFSTLMRELDLPERQAHDAINDAVMAGLAFLKLKRLLGR
jgi:DNA polymerase-3 subunit epsilon